MESVKLYIYITGVEKDHYKQHRVASQLVVDECVVSCTTHKLDFLSLLWKFDRLLLLQIQVIDNTHTSLISSPPHFIPSQ